MPATVKTYAYVGNPATPSDLANFSDNLRFNCADTVIQNTDLSDPCVKPDAGQGPNFSWWKHLSLFAEVEPDNYINNIKLYTDGDNDWGAEVTVKVGLAPTYVQASGNAESGLELTEANHAGLSGPPDDLFSYDDVSMLDVPTASGGDHTGVGRITQFVALQLSVTDQATGGTKAAQNVTWRYDEA